MGPAVSGKAEAVFLGLRDLMLAGARLSEAFHRRLPTHEGHGLGLVALYIVRAAGRRGLAQVELARQLGKPASSTTRLIDSLETMGVLHREHHPSDRRINMVLLTPKGRALLDGVLSDLGRAAERNSQVVADPNQFDRQLAQMMSFIGAISGCDDEHRPAA